MTLTLQGLTVGAVIIYGRAVTEHPLADFEWSIQRLVKGGLITSDRPVAPMAVSGQGGSGNSVTLDPHQV